MADVCQPVEVLTPHTLFVWNTISNKLLLDWMWHTALNDDWLCSKTNHLLYGNQNTLLSQWWWSSGKMEQKKNGKWFDLIWFGIIVIVTYIWLNKNRISLLLPFQYRNQIRSNWNSTFCALLTCRLRQKKIEKKIRKNSIHISDKCQKTVTFH